MIVHRRQISLVVTQSEFIAVRAPAGTRAVEEGKKAQTVAY